MVRTKPIRGVGRRQKSSVRAVTGLLTAFLMLVATFGVLPGTADATFPSPEPDLNLPTGEIQLQNHKWGRFLSVGSGDKVLSEAETGASTQWVLEPVSGKVNTYVVRNTSNNRILAGYFSKVYSYGGVAHSAKYWKISKDSNGGYYLKNHKYGKYLDGDRDSDISASHFRDDDNIWKIIVPNAAPAVTAPDAQVSTVGDAVSVPVVASDADGDTLTYSATGLPAGLSIDPATGVISGTVADGAEAGSPYTVTVTADDGTVSTSATFVWTVNPAPNTAPAVIAPADQVSTTGDAVSVPVVASDADGDTLTYSAAGLPAGLSIDPATGVISGTVADGAEAGSPYTVTVSADDGTISTSVTFVWTVNAPDPVNTAPAVIAPADQVSTTGDAVSVPVVASDADGDTLTYSATGLPAGLSIDPATGVISGTVADGAEAGSPYLVTVTADDGTDTASVSFIWTVNAPDPVNTAPEVTAVPNQVSTTGDDVSVPVVASDADGDTLTYSAAGLPAGLSIDPATGVISGTVADGADSGSPYLVTVTADDGTDTASVSFIWTVNAPPPAETGTIAGTITEADGTPVPSAAVDLFTANDDGSRGTFISSVASDENGDYVFTAAPGCYVLTFIAPDGETYNGSQFLSAPACVEANGVTVVDAVLDPMVADTGSIGGTLFSSDGAGVPDGQVDLFSAAADGSRGAYIASAFTGADGTYSFDAAPGCYVLTFIAPDGEAFNGQQFFNNSGCVVAGEATGGIDAVLDGPVVGTSAVGGTITNADGTPAPGITAELWTQNDDGTRGTYLRSTSTGDDGTYSFDTDPGCYVVTLLAGDGSFLGEQFLNLSICVEAGEVVSNLNAVLDAPAGDPIKVTISDSSILEGDDGDVTTAGFKVRLSRPSDVEQTVVVTTVDGTATAGEDYEALTQTITFAPGVTLVTFKVQVTGDTVVEMDEGLTAVVSDPSPGLVIADATGHGTIRNDD